MKLNELKKNLESRLVDVKQKMEDVENALQNQEHPSETLKDVHLHLKKLYEEIILQYDQIDAMETEEYLDETNLQKNVYANLESFDAAFSEAGTLIGDREFKTRSRSHSVDFKNPHRTE